MSHLMHLLAANQLHYLQWASNHGYHCWLEVGLKFHHGNATAYLQDVICKKAR